MNTLLQKRKLLNNILEESIVVASGVKGRFDAYQVNALVVHLAEDSKVITDISPMAKNSDNSLKVKVYSSTKNRVVFTKFTRHTYEKTKVLHYLKFYTTFRLARDFF